MPEMIGDLAFPLTLMSEIVNMPSGAIEGLKWRSIYLAKWIDASSLGHSGTRN
jgi:hypothetical protein